MKFKKEYLILFLIIIVLVLFIVLRDQDRIQYALPDIEEIDLSEITLIQISEKDNVLTLKQTGRVWTVNAEEYPADENRIDRILDFIKKPVVVTMISDSKNYSRYGLDKENRIEVNVYSGDRIIRSINTGFSVSGHGYTFIRLGNDHRVYHGRGRLRDLFDTDPDGIRDRTVLTFNRNEIDSITIQKGEKFLAMTLKEHSADHPADDMSHVKHETLWKDADGNDIDRKIPDQILSTLSNLRCEGYIYEGKLEDSKIPILSVSLKGEREYSLFIYEKEDNQEDYPALSSETLYPFLISGWRAENLINIIDKMEKTE